VSTFKVSRAGGDEGQEDAQIGGRVLLIPSRLVSVSVRDIRCVAAVMALPTSWY